MFERFTYRARKAMALANQEAQRFNHEYVGSEHILLGIVKEGSGTCARVLKNRNVDLGQVRLEVEKLVRSGPDGVSMGKLPLVPAAEKVIQYAIEQARSFNHSYMGIDHLLLGLIRDPNEVSAQVLLNLGLNLEGLREEVLDLLRKGGDPDAVTAAAVEHKPPDMFERFTDRARKVLALANQEAQRFNHEYVGTEHILLGLVKEGSGVGANVLKNLDIDLRKVRLDVEKFVKRGHEQVVMGKLPQTPRAKRVIEFALAEARGLNHNYIGSEHLLLGLIEEHEGVAALVLLNLGLTLEQVRKEVLNLLGAGVDQSETGAAARRRGWGMRLRGKPPRTPHADRVMNYAEQEAVSMKQGYVGTQHVLLGLFHDPECIAARVLAKLGVNPEKVREEVINLPGDEPPAGKKASDST